ncbi:MAG: MCE family protein [Sphingomonadaceae bacterium]|jgi:phospholipid/cholesterol/gamma-HCH transport system substrate-binding protein|nr:MCE family protein [Sphingomonadaceae bacterium]NBU77782.1 MCE family protein [Sphingomonadaceae bacterium]NCA01613.1 MCE family protein [Sphingomonadaceae bacterium]
METRSNQLLVGTVVLALLAALLGFAIWIAGMSRGNTKEYDIFFRQSVEGLAKGSSVTFAGVPSGQVRDIELWQPNPEFVRVRIAVDEELPVLIGTTASIQGVGFTGVSQIQLTGAVKGAPPIAELGPAGAPTIPAKSAGLGALLNNAPQLVERLSTLTERLSELMSDENQKSITHILKNVDKVSGHLARSGPELEASISEARITIREAGVAAQQIAQIAGTTNQILTEDGRPLVQDLRRTVNSAERSMAALDAALAEAKPGLHTFSTQTLPEMGQLVRDLRAMSESLNSVASKIDQQGAGALIGGPKLPDYKGGKAGQ